MIDTLKSLEMTDGRRRFAIAGSLGALATALYLGTLSRLHEPDAFVYADAIRQGTIAGLFHPNHLLYEVIARANFVVWQSLGWHGDSMLPTQSFNAVVGGIGVGIFAWILFGIVRNSWIVGACAIGLATSFAYWYHSVEVAVHILPILLVLIAFALALRYLQDTARAVPVFLGLVWGVSVLFMQSNIFFLLPAATAIVIANNSNLRRLRHGLVFLAVAAVPIAIGYLVLPCAFLDICGVQPVLHWTRGYARLPWYGFHRSTWYYAAFGYGRTIFGGALPSDSLVRNVVSRFGRGQYALQLFPLALTSWLLLLILITARDVWKTHHNTMLLALVWLTPFFLFGIWWEPSNVKYWIPTLPPFMLLVCLAAERLWLRVKSRQLARPALQIAGVGMLIILVGTSYVRAIRPLSDTSMDRNAMFFQDLNGYVRMSDFLLVPTHEYGLPAYMKFHAGIEATTLHYVAETFLVDTNLQSTTSYEAYLDSKYSSVQQRGGRVYVLNSGFEVPGWTVDRKLVSREEAERIMSKYSLQTVIRFTDGNTLYELKRVPPSIAQLSK